MSHIVEYSPDSIDQKLVNINALKTACDCILTKSGKPALELRLMGGCVIGEDGLVYRDGKVVTKGNGHYRTWKDDHGGRLVGDWPLPTGMTADEVGNNAVATIALTEEAKKEIGRRDAYEVGVIPHLDPETGQMTYALTHDFYGGGMGVEKFIGETKIKYGKQARGADAKVEEAHGNVVMFYQMTMAKMAAEQAGKDIEFFCNEDGSYSAVVDKATVGIQA